MKRTYYFITAVVAMIGLAACSLEEDNIKPEPGNEEPGLITISGEISQVYETRANDSGFADKDKIGVYIVDYDGSKAGTLKNNGNRADNVKFTFDEAAYKWTSDRDIYWKDNETHIDVFGYYPFTTIENVNEYSFEIQKDQSTDALNGKSGGYETSDFLWGKAENAAPTDRIVRLSFSHRMAGVRVSLIKGTGFSDAEWSEASKEVLILNTKRKAVIDLATGIVTASGEVDGTGIIPYRKGKDFRAVVAPQEIAAGTSVISVTVAGIPYKFSRSEAMTFNASKQHNFTITVNKKAPGDFEFKLSDESITAWENDAVSHDATTREYIVINVETPGTLDKCIEAAGKDISKIVNLKLTGKINSRDFGVMKYMMPLLTALNLKEVTIVKSDDTARFKDYMDGLDQGAYLTNEDNEIPDMALRVKKSLSYIILPDSITKIAQTAFQDCINLTGSLIIPDGVTSIGASAFQSCSSFTGILSLPESLTEIKNNAFDGCNFICEFHLPAKLKHIGEYAFNCCTGLYGEIHLPESLECIGAGAFSQCTSLSGSITIPKSITTIEPRIFYFCYGLNGRLNLHDDITSIGEEAFNDSPLKGELILPSKVTSIGRRAFSGCDFSGKLVLPEGLLSIGDEVFYNNWRLSGTVDIPGRVISIGAGAFEECRNIEGIVLPESIETIQYKSTWQSSHGAFKNCYGLNKIVCKGTIPPYIQAGAFDGVPKDNFTVEVPESAVIQYQAAPGWNEFKRISAYRNLSVRPNVATALNTKVTRELVLDADEEWIVESAPDWVIISKKEGNGKTVVKVEFLQMPPGSNRKGNIVFKLKDKDYRTTCHVTQYDYRYAEDEILTLREAKKGNGINLVFLGDGFSAKDISEGLLLNKIQEAVGHFFSIEPYKTYKEYFNVYTGIAVSPESGIGGVNTIIYNRFNTSAKGGVTLGGRNGESDYNEIFKYACKAPTVNEGNLNMTLIVIVPNTSDYGGICYMYDSGEAIAYCPMSDYGYPMDFRGVIQHEAGGHGFGKLGDEHIYHNAFIDACGCSCCGHVDEFNGAKAKGWYENLSLTGKMDEVPWSHLIVNERYGKIVDIYEGGFMHSRGVYRSEYNSCMNNEIPYYSTISREAIVRRIMEYAGEEYSFEKFVANDNVENLPETASAATKASPFSFSVSGRTQRHEPVFMGKRPTLK